MTPNEVVALLDKALKDFGTYPLYDKGAHEVMDVPFIVRNLHTQGAVEAGKVLVEVLKHEHGEPLVEAIVVDWDKYDDFEALLEWYPELQRFY